MLLDAGITANTNCGSRAIGYRQALDALAAWHADPGALSEGAVLGLVQAIQAASRQLCHRQMTWFRDEAMFRYSLGKVGQARVLLQGIWGWGWTGRYHSRAAVPCCQRIGPGLHINNAAGGLTRMRGRKLYWLRSCSAGLSRSTRAAAATAGASRAWRGCWHALALPRLLRCGASATAEPMRCPRCSPACASSPPHTAARSRSKRCGGTCLSSACSIKGQRPCRPPWQRHASSLTAARGRRRQRRRRRSSPAGRRWGQQQWRRRQQQRLRSERRQPLSPGMHRPYD